MKKWFLVVSMISSSAFAIGPRISSSCEVAKSIRTPPNSGGYFLTADCKTAYVLPPAQASRKVTGITSGNLGRCSEISSLNKMMAELNRQTTEAIQGKVNEEALTTIRETREKIKSDYADLASALGASVEMIFDMNIEKNVQRFRQYNTAVPVAFMAVPLKEVTLAWNQAKNQDPDMRIAFNEDLPLPKDSNVGAGSYSARLDLSLFGACKLRDPFTREIPEQIDSQALAGLITPTAFYKYEVGATFGYTATYNKGLLAKKIRESSSKGGFFKTATASSLIETAETSGWFSLTMSCNDSRVCAEVKAQTAWDIKQRLMQEVLDDISMARLGVSLPPVESGTPGKNGASAAAEGLRKCAHPYCQAGAIVLDIANSTFGGASKTDSYISANNSKAEETVEITTPVMFSGSVGFSKD